MKQNSFFSPLPINKIMGKLWHIHTHWNITQCIWKSCRCTSNNMDEFQNITWRKNISCKKLHMVWHHFYVSQNTVSNAHLHDKIYIFVKKKIKKIVNTNFRIVRKPENSGKYTERSRSNCDVPVLKLQCIFKNCASELTYMLHITFCKYKLINRLRRQKYNPQKWTVLKSYMSRQTKQWRKVNLARSMKKLTYTNKVG